MICIIFDKFISRTNNSTLLKKVGMLYTYIYIYVCLICKFHTSVLNNVNFVMILKLPVHAICMRCDSCFLTVHAHWKKKYMNWLVKLCLLSIPGYCQHDLKSWLDWETDVLYHYVAKVAVYFGLECRCDSVYL